MEKFKFLFAYYFTLGFSNKRFEIQTIGDEIYVYGTNKMIKENETDVKKNENQVELFERI